MTTSRRAWCARRRLLSNSNQCRPGSCSPCSVGLALLLAGRRLLRFLSLLVACCSRLPPRRPPPRCRRCLGRLLRLCGLRLAVALVVPLVTDDHAPAPAVLGVHLLHLLTIRLHRTALGTSSRTPRCVRRAHHHAALRRRLMRRVAFLPLVTAHRQKKSKEEGMLIVCRLSPPPLCLLACSNAPRQRRSRTALAMRSMTPLATTGSTEDNRQGIVFAAP